MRGRANLLLLRSALLLAGLLILSCSANRMYRPVSVEEHPDYDPMTEYGFSPAQLSTEEQHVLTGTSLLLENDDGADLILQEDTW